VVVVGLHAVVEYRMGYCDALADVPANAVTDRNDRRYHRFGDAGSARYEDGHSADLAARCEAPDTV
jgi:hypothetical protein